MAREQSTPDAAGNATSRGGNGGSAQHPEVIISAGRVRGRWRETDGAGKYGHSAAFLGIPFAEPPTGERRFTAPVPAQPWDGTLDAVEFGATAQRGDPGVTLIPEPSVPGDCTLNVNVFTPAPRVAEDGEVGPDAAETGEAEPDAAEDGGEPDAADDRAAEDGRAGTPRAKQRAVRTCGSETAGLPVLVWIHGGGYYAGSPASPWYDGRNFNRDGVVTVTISYRLGFDGFGWIDGAPANRGVRDWLLALEWVQENIAAFGGDPDRVTIAGQSAGGGAVMTLLGMEAAQHLFHGVYAISAALGDVAPARAEKLAHAIAARAGVEPTLEGFRSLSEEQLLQLQKEATKLDPTAMTAIVDEGLPLGPVVDGELIRRPTRESLRAGVGADKPLVIGATDDEFTMALTDAARALRWVPQSALLAKLGVPRRAREAYLAANTDVVALGKARLAGRVVTDRMFRQFVVNIAADRGNAPTWTYRFSWPSGTFGFAEHCLDVPFFFDCLNAPAIEPLAGPHPPQSLADEVHAAATAFIRDGEPGWPQHGAEPGTSRVFDVPSRMQHDAYASVRPLLAAR